MSVNAVHLAVWSLCLLILHLLWPLLEPLLWAVIFVYATWPLHEGLTRWLGGRQHWSALLIPLGIVVILLLPLASGLFFLQREWAELYADVSAWLERPLALPDWLTDVTVPGQQLTFLLTPFETLQGLVRHYGVPGLKQVGTQLMAMLGGVGFSMARGGLTLFIMFFLYRDGQWIATSIKHALTRLLGAELPAYYGVVESTTRAVVYGIVLTAAGQSLIATLGYLAAGLKAPLLLGSLTFLLGMIPFGVVLVWVSASVSLLLDGQTWAALGLFLWGALVVSWVDNLIRPWIISQNVRIPFLLIVLGIVGGFVQYGFPGLFIGPVILNLGLTAWNRCLTSTEMPTVAPMQRSEIGEKPEG
jgi:predicted PurR-regulated permease PerM